MGIINKIIEYYQKNKDPIAYAKKVGVKFPGGGDGCRLLSTNFDTEPWLISIGNHVELSGNVSFITHDGATWVFRTEDRYKYVIRYGAITIEDNCFIGKNSIILPGVTIGKNSVVGAGSVVTKDVPCNSVVAGNPAKVLKSIEEYAEKCLAETPNYSIDNYKKNKRAEVERVYIERE